MDASDPLTDVATAKTSTSPSAESDEPTPSERMSVYRLTGATRGSRWLGAWESFIPLVVFCSLDGITRGLEYILEVDDWALVVTPAPARIGGSLSSVLGDWSVRNALVLAAVAFFVVAFGAMSTAWYVIFEALEHTKWRRRAMMGVAAVALGVFFIIWGRHDNGASATMGALQDWVQSTTHIAKLRTLYLVMYASGKTVLACAACAMCAILFPHLGDEDLKPSSQRDIAFLGRRMRWTRAMLYVLAPLFAVCTVVNYTATSMIAVYLPGPDDQAAMLHMASRSTLLFATLYSIVLACMYAPTEAILRIRATKVASDAHVTVGERAAWLKDKGLRLNVVDQFKAVVALLSPILVGLFGRSVSGLLKG